MNIISKGYKPVLMKRSVFLANIAVLLFEMAGLFAKWIKLESLSITFGRVLFSSVSLGIYMLLRKQSFRTENKKDLLRLAGAGMILALHWWAFLKSIQLSTVAIGTITFSSFPLFVTILEPLITRKKPIRRNVISAAVILSGVCITIPKITFDSNYFQGILFGLLSSLTYAVLTLMNKGFAEKYSGVLTAFYEQTAAALALFPFVLRTGFHPTGSDLLLLINLGVFCTAAAHTMFITALKGISAQLAGIISSLETVYGIIFAMLFLGEIPSMREITGALIITGTVIAVQIKADRQTGGNE